MRVNTLGAIILSFVVGALIGALVGFSVAVPTTQEARFTADLLPLWLMQPIGFGWWSWALMGGVVGASFYGSIIFFRRAAKL